MPACLYSQADARPGNPAQVHGHTTHTCTQKPAFANKYANVHTSFHTQGKLPGSRIRGSRDPPRSCSLANPAGPVSWLCHAAAVRPRSSKTSIPQMQIQGNNTDLAGPRGGLRRNRQITAASLHAKALCKPSFLTSRALLHWGRSHTPGPPSILPMAWYVPALPPSR